jgi:hypothetical protein
MNCPYHNVRSEHVSIEPSTNIYHTDGKIESMDKAISGNASGEIE